MCNTIEHVNRTAWNDNFPDVITLCKVEDRDHSEAYKRAKYAKNSNQAKELMAELKHTKHFKQAVETLKALAAQHPEGITLLPISSLEKAFDPRNQKPALGSNPLPLAIALALSDETGFDVNTDVVQTNVVGHTGAYTLDRFAHPATFSGQVKPGSKIILIDDHVSMGSTAANCKGYVEGLGAEVVAMCSLTAKQTGRCLRMSPRTRNKLMGAENFATIGCHSDQSKKVFGYSLDCMTNSEGQKLLFILEEGKKKKGESYNLQNVFDDIINHRKTDDLTKDLSGHKEAYNSEKMNSNFIHAQAKSGYRNNGIRR